MPYKEFVQTHMKLELVHNAIDDEPEFPGDMPDEMWEAIRNNRDAMMKAMKLAVQLTKSGIKDRLNDLVGGGGICKGKNCSAGEMQEIPGFEGTNEALAKLGT